MGKSSLELLALLFLVSDVELILSDSECTKHIHSQSALKKSKKPLIILY